MTGSILPPPQLLQTSQMFGVAFPS